MPPVGFCLPCQHLHRLFCFPVYNGGSVEKFASKILWVVVSEKKGEQMSFREGIKTSQELRMLSSVTLDWQVTKIVMNSGSQL